MEKLKACPWGLFGEPILEKICGDWYIRCASKINYGEVLFGPFIRKSTIVQEWNRRPE